MYHKEQTTDTRNSQQTSKADTYSLKFTQLKGTLDVA